VYDSWNDGFRGCRFLGFRHHSCIRPGFGRSLWGRGFRWCFHGGPRASI
jgi:hypothetical protein